MARTASAASRTSSSSPTSRYTGAMRSPARCFCHWVGLRGTRASGPVRRSGRLRWRHHRRVGARCLEAEQDRGDHVPDEAALDLFGLAGGTDGVGGVVAELTRHVDSLRRDEHRAVARLRVEIDVVAHRVFGDTRRAAHRQRIGAERIRSDRQLSHVDRRLVHDRHVGILQRAGKFALELAATGHREVDLLHPRRQRGALAQMETAGTDQRHEGDDRGDAKRTKEVRAHGYPATMLTILPGTTITLRTVWPSSRRATFGSARAMASASSLEADAGTSMVARSLPFTCTA